MSPQRTPRLSDVLLTLLARAKTEIRVAMPAVVQAYNAEQQSVDVQPLLQETVTDAEGNVTSVTLPVVPSVPVVFPGGGGYRLTFPLAQGDIVLLICADRSIDVWSAGKGGAPVDPVALTRHMLADAFALPCVHSFGAPLATAPTTGASLGQDTGLQVGFQSDHIEVGGNTDAAALASKVLTRLQALEDTFNGHTHVLAIVGTCAAAPGPIVATGTAAVPDPPATDSTDVSSTMIKTGG